MNRDWEQLPDAEPPVRGIDFAGSTLGALLTGRIDCRELSHQLLELTVRTVPIAVLCLAFFGVVLEEHAAREARRALISLDRVGPMFVELMVREFAPAISGLILAARAGSGIAAEIGWMAQSEQLDALQLAGRDAAADLFAPRLAGGLLASLFISILGVAAAGLAAGVWGHASAGCSVGAFLSFRLVTGRDWVFLFSKALANGLTVPLAAIHAGLTLGGEPDGVARSTSAGVVRGTLWVLGIDVAIGATLWWLP